MFRKKLTPASAAIAGLLLATAAGPAFAVLEINTVPGYTAAGAPLALHGHDPVAYFKSGRPQHGKAEFTAQHDGAAYYFANEANMKTFTSNPDRFVPAYGGYCAYGVSVGKKFDGDPRYWKIVDDKLYLNLNADIAKAFNADVTGSLNKANTQWPKIKSKAPSDL